MRRALIAASGMVAVMASLAVHAAPLTDEKPLPDGRAVVLRIEAGEVVVEPGEPGRVAVEVDLQPGQRLLWREGLDRLIVVLDDSVRTVPRPSRLRLRVPPAADLVLRVGNSRLDVSGVGGQRLRVEAGRGDVVVASAAPDIAIETTQGAIEARSDGGRLATNSVGGRQRLQASGAVEVEASSVGGPIEAQLAVGARVRLASVAGGIRLSVGAGSGVDARLETLSGDIELRLPPGTPFGVRLAPSSGTVELPPTYAPRADGLWASAPGGGVARLTSFSGNIRVIEPPPLADTP